MNNETRNGKRPHPTFIIDYGRFNGSTVNSIVEVAVVGSLVRLSLLSGPQRRGCRRVSVVRTKWRRRTIEKSLLSQPLTRRPAGALAGSSIRYTGSSSAYPLYITRTPWRILGQRHGRERWTLLSKSYHRSAYRVIHTSWYHNSSLWSHFVNFILALSHSIPYEKLKKKICRENNCQDKAFYQNTSVTLVYF